MGGVEQWLVVGVTIFAMCFGMDGSGSAKEGLRLRLYDPYSALFQLGRMKRTQHLTPNVGSKASCILSAIICVGDKLPLRLRVSSLGARDLSGARSLSQ